MAGQQPTLPGELFDARAFESAFTESRAIELCKQAIARATEYQHRRFRDGAQAREAVRRRGVWRAVRELVQPWFRHDKFTLKNR